MNLTVLEVQALSMLIRNVEEVIELYWDTENGAKLSQSLRIFRAACGGIALDQMDRANSSKARLVVDAHCPACGFLNDDEQTDGLGNISLALEHASTHGHIVILNGTADLPTDEDLRPALTAYCGANCSVP
ncbi:MAG TPA: hypothetical protein VLC51_06125 [Nitrospira sp.]|nr:hypothetical protein [Nitrospira sp.]